MKKDKGLRKREKKNEEVEEEEISLVSYFKLFRWYWIF